MISKRRFSEVRLYFIKLILVLGMSAMFAVTWSLTYRNILYIDPFYAKGDVAMVVLFAMMFYAFAKLYGGLDLSSGSAGGLSYALTVAGVITVGFFYIIICLLTRRIPSILPLVALVIGMTLYGFLWSKAAIRMHSRLVPPQRISIVYGNEEALYDAQEIIRDNPQLFALVEEISTADGMDAAFSRLDENRPDSIMLCGIGSTERNDFVKYCISRAIQAYIRPNIGDFLISNAYQMQLSNLPVMLCQRSYPPVWYIVLKRGMDILLSLIALLIFSPFMLVTAAAIRLYDHGPIFYKQVRLTKNGKEFYVYKFRSMRVDAEKDGVARLASQNDDRITPVGKIIRSLRIDEMPQLFCILKGDMTIVGPRPERPEIARQYEQEIPEFAMRLQAKAGLTGLAQVYGKYNTTPYNKLQMDLQYIGSMGVVTDLKIILATIKILFVPESTEGVAAGQTTAAKESGSEEKEEVK